MNSGEKSMGHIHVMNVKIGKKVGLKKVKS